MILLCHESYINTITVISVNYHYRCILIIRILFYVKTFSNFYNANLLCLIDLLLFLLRDLLWYKVLPILLDNQSLCLVFELSRVWYVNNSACIQIKSVEYFVRSSYLQLPECIFRYRECKIFLIFFKWNYWEKFIAVPNKNFMNSS